MRWKKPTRVNFRWWSQSLTNSGVMSQLPRETGTPTEAATPSDRQRHPGRTLWNLIDLWREPVFALQEDHLPLLSCLKLKPILASLRRMVHPILTEYNYSSNHQVIVGKVVLTLRKVKIGFSILRISAAPFLGWSKLQQENKVNITLLKRENHYIHLSSTNPKVQLRDQRNHLSHPLISTHQEYYPSNKLLIKPA